MLWPKAILLDFYGTVVEEDGACLAQIKQEIMQHATTSVSEAEIGRFWGKQFVTLCHECVDESFMTERDIELTAVTRVLEFARAPLIARALCERLFEVWRNPPIFPEAKGVLASLDVSVCLVSNIDNAELSSALANLQLSFDMVVTSEDCRAYKPHPAPFLRALELLGLEAHEVLHVGDSPSSDVRGAQALGIPVMWVNRTGRDLSDSYLPEYVSTDLTGLQRLLHSQDNLRIDIGKERAGAVKSL